MSNYAKTLVISVVIALSIIIISIPIWNLVNVGNGSYIANAISDLDINVVVGKFESLKIMKDETALESLTPTTLSLRNRNGFNKDYKLVLLIDKESTIDSSFVRVSINDEIYKINELTKTEDTKNEYYELFEDNISQYSTETYEVKMWLTSEAKNLDSTSFIIANFVTK